MARLTTMKGKVVEGPALVQRLFSDPRAAWLWLLPRLWLGWQWISAAEHKIFNPAWVSDGNALKGYWANAIKIPATGQPPITFDWYRSFLTFLLNAQAYTWFAKLVAYGELLVGIALIIGAFTGVAAFFGAFMNWNYMMAGTASTNPLLLVIAIGLILAWKVAGYVGADFVLLPTIGTPWGRIAERKEVTAPGAEPVGVHS